MKIARDPDEDMNRIAAAIEILLQLEMADMADFAGLLKGEHNLEDLRAMGINTRLIKKLKERTRKIETKDGPAEELVEREIELHDRSAQNFDRVVNHTDGNPTQRTESVNTTHITIDSAEATLDTILARRLGEPRQN